jgi:hypothetical protein
MEIYAKRFNDYLKIEPQSSLAGLKNGEVYCFEAKQQRDPKWIELGIEACRASSVDPQYFVDRYLDKLDMPKNLVVEQAYRDLRDGAI